MIKVVAKNYMMPDKLDEIMKLEKELVEATRKETGNISYGLYRDIEHPEIMTMIEEWDDRDALRRHMDSEHFKRLVPMIGKYTTKDVDMNIYEQAL